MAYIDNEFNNNKSMARQNIHKALKEKFSSDELESLARTYKMKLDASVGDISNLLADLKWLEKKTDISGVSHLPILTSHFICCCAEPSQEGCVP